jgi:hypothetical protein
VEYRFGFSLSVSIVYYGMLSCFTSIDKTKGYDKVYDPCLAIYYKWFEVNKQNGLWY